MTRIYETYHLARHAYNTHLPCCQNQTAPIICIVFIFRTLADLFFGWVSKIYFYSNPPNILSAKIRFLFQKIINEIVLMKNHQNRMNLNMAKSYYHCPKLDWHIVYLSKLLFRIILNNNFALLLK